MNNVSVSSVGKSYKALETHLGGNLKKLINLDKKGSFIVGLYLVDNMTMRGLNRKFRGKNNPTNVLSFVTPKEFVMPPKKSKDLGEIYLAPDFIKSKGEDINFLLIHGFLHLLGFNHNKKDDTITMQHKEQKLLSKLTKLD